MPSSSSAHGHGYDANLLADVPKLTPDAIQAGYNTAVLDAQKKPSSAPKRDIQDGRRHVENKTAPSTPAVVKESSPSIPAKVARLPFYRRKRGIVIIAIVALVLLGAIIGGVVGGVMHNKARDFNGTPDTQPTASFTTTTATSSVTQDVGGGGGQGGGQGGGLGGGVNRAGLED